MPSACNGTNIMNKKILLVSLAISSVSLIACQQNKAQTEPMTPTITVKEMMTGVFEPVSNALWAVALDENIPQTDEDWKALENQSIQLLTVSAALSLGGSGPKDIAWTQDERWQQHLQQMVEIGNGFLAASRDKNYQGLLDAGEVLIEPCGNCHTDFPGDSE